MKQKKSFLLCLLLCGTLLLSGCSSILEREYRTTEEHNSKYWEQDASGTLRAETYQDVVNDLLILIGQHAESATLRLYQFADDTAVTDALESAAVEVQQETPVGSYAVEYITSEMQSRLNYYEVSLHISYLRTAEELQSIVNATSATALPDLLNLALDSGRSALTVRLGYWGSNALDSVRQAVRSTRSDRGIDDSNLWMLICYPSAASAGILEFRLDGSEPDIPSDHAMTVLRFPEQP